MMQQTRDRIVILLDRAGIYLIKNRQSILTGVAILGVLVIGAWLAKEFPHGLGGFGSATGNRWK
jgi:hypothetical protein